MYKLPDSPQKKALVAYIKQQIEICQEQQYINEGTSQEMAYEVAESIYRDILKKIE